MKKMCILIFTCFSVITVHMELVDNMPTHPVDLALVRIFNSYGVPTHIYSDNACCWLQLD